MNPDSAPTLSLAQHFLIAMPGMEDDLFAGSVIYVCDHRTEGALGLCINKAADLQVDELFAQIDLPLGRTDLRGRPMVWGGPVQAERGFVLHNRLLPGAEGDAPYLSTLDMPDGLQMTTSRDILEHLSQGRGPENVLIALGYSAWDAGQLEDEIARNAWLTVPATAPLIFETPLEQRHAAALRLLGIEPAMLSAMAGRA